jgi:hypothetical protein
MEYSKWARGYSIVELPNSNFPMVTSGTEVPPDGPHLHSGDSRAGDLTFFTRTPTPAVGKI